jgi:hypothetical protein
MALISFKLRAPVAFISLLVVIGGLVWHVNRRDRMAQNKDDSIHQAGAVPVPERPTPASEPVRNANPASFPPKSLFDDVVRYTTAPDDVTQCAIAKEVAFSQTHLWESCALRMSTIQLVGPELDSGAEAIAHFASVYFHRGPEQKQELISLLQSDDLHLVRGLLALLKYTRDLNAKGAIIYEGSSGKPLGGAELLPHISRIATRHPKLELSVATTLCAYGGLAKSEIDTLLRIVLSPDEEVSVLARLEMRVHEVDEELVKRLGLDDEDTVDRPLTEDQRDKILGYLKDRGKTPTVGPQKTDNSGASCNSLYGDIVRYRSAKDAAARVAIARGVASSQSNVLESCALRAGYTQGSSLDRRALAHFVSAYFNRGEKQKQELYSLLLSRDTQLVIGMLWLLWDARDLDPNGELNGEKPLGGSEVPTRLSRLAKDRPDLAGVAVITLGYYGPLAKGETATLLRVVLSDSESDSRDAKRVLSSIDFDGLYSKFSLDLDKPLTEEQRSAIEAYLQLHGGK